MGLMTYQPVGTGKGTMKKGYSNSLVEVYSRKSIGIQAKHNKIVFEITAIFPDISKDEKGGQQRLQLTMPEMEKILDGIIDVCNDEVRAKIAVQLVQKIAEDLGQVKGDTQVKGDRLNTD